MRNGAISRAQFLAGAGAVGAAAATGPLLAAGRAAAAAAAAGTAAQVTEGPPPGRGLKHRGVCYTLGAGETPGTAWSAARMRKDIQAIKNDLHADSVQVTGDGVDRLTATASEAAEQGLHIWLQPTLGDRPEREILEHLAETGMHAERLRRHGTRVVLSIGCEVWLFVPGIVPGDDALERIENMQKGHVDWQQMQRRLHRFTTRAAALSRSVFRGQVSYAAAQDETVDWNLFDIVGIDYYSQFPRPDDYIRELTKFLRWGKPLAICEFGSCTYLGAPQQADMGWNVVDHTKVPEEIIGDLVRSEPTQAAYLIELLDVFESMGLYSAMAFEFLTPDAPHRPEPRYDLDMASYSIVKTIKDRPDDPASDWHWEPKQAFHALARAYGRAPRRP
ncbi:abortive phage infection protein [Streptomyces sp. NPDC050161]|uniref:abortive phage infection protein n=1 Tax=Streptomyces sp. NPDC050161 TaxID=3365604 RepID=UPI0037B5F095